MTDRLRSALQNSKNNEQYGFLNADYWRVVNYLREPQSQNAYILNDDPYRKPQSDGNRNLSDHIVFKFDLPQKDPQKPGQNVAPNERKKKGLKELGFTHQFFAEIQ